MTTPCFMLTPTGEVLRGLNVFASSGERCPVSGHGHASRTLIGAASKSEVARTESTIWRDPRWATHCACGYAFEDDALRSVSHDELYRAADGQVYSSRPGDAPLGAMWHAPHMAAEYPGPDGLSLVVVLPSGEQWLIDGPSRAGGRWTRTGEPPRITAHPSIATPRYHGWLRDGVLSDDLEGRTYGGEKVDGNI